MRTASVLLFALLSLACSGPPRRAGTTPTMEAARARLARLEGDRITLSQHVQFEHDSDVIRGESRDLLDDIAAVLRDNPDITTLHVIGHTDESGDHDHNVELSERRAAAVVTALRRRGIEQAMDAAGRGETELLCSEDTEECHARNRRVELLVVR